RERTRRQLIDAAIRVFAEKGVANSSIQEIAVAAGVANGTFYNHFPTKEAVMEAVAVQTARILSERIDESYRHITDAAERM
ncbi:TetR family transcriptional regulator, partial [Acinetobacter baumannii]